LMTIGRIAQTMEVATSRLSYYEQENILAPTTRNKVGYRLYDGYAVERLQFIRSAQAVGFTLDDIRMLLGREDSNARFCQADVQHLLERRWAEVD